jgi:hypothetical protein
MTQNEQNEVTPIISEKNKPNVLYKNFKFYRKTVTKNKIIWYCINKHCNGKLHTTTDHLIIKDTPHNHESLSMEEIKILNQKIKIKQMAVGSSLKPSSILSNIYSHLDQSERQMLPKTRSIKNQISYLRKPFIHFTYDTNDDIPNELKTTLSGAKFLIYDSGIFDTNRILVFSDGNLF